MSVAAYLEAMKKVWSPSTYKSESSRLLRYSSAMDGNIERLEEAATSLSLYSRKTLYLRASAYWGWAYPEEPNPYKLFLQQNRSLRNAYSPKKIETSFEEAEAAINAIPDEAIKKRAIEMLFSAQRWCESGQAGTTVKGKGGRIRPSFRPSVAGPEFDASYATFLRKLKAHTGLTPHVLRKLALTRLTQKGATAPDLMRVAGWSSMAPALVYIQARRDEQLKEMMK